MNTGLGAERLAALGEQGAKSGGNLVWFAFDTPGGETDCVNSRQLQLLDSNWIALKRGSGAMGLVAVEFDGESLLLPVGVDLVSGNEVVDRGPGQTRAPHEGDEEAFCASSGHSWVSIDRRGDQQSLAAGMTTTARDEEVDGANVK